MARTANITFEKVAAVADKIELQGNKATTRAVREVLGSGSMATVLKFLQQWQNGQVRQSQAVDDSIDPAITRAICNQIFGKVQESTAEARLQLANLQAETDAIIVENEHQAIEIETQAAEFTKLQEQYAAIAGRVQQIVTEAARTVTELAAERQASEHARVELAKAELRLEAVPRIEAEIEKIRSELVQARTQVAELHECAAVATAKMELEVSQRRSIEAQLLEAVRQREEATKRALISAESLGNERVAVHASQARLEAAAREIDAANQAASKARAEAKKAGEEAAELRGQLAAVKGKALAKAS